MQKNAQQLVVRDVLDFFRSMIASNMDWPPRSSEIYPIEYLWDVFVEWENLRQEIIQNLSSSMPTSMEAVIRARKGSIHY